MGFPAMLKSYADQFRFGPFFKPCLSIVSETEEEPILNWVEEIRETGKTTAEGFPNEINNF